METQDQAIIRLLKTKESSHIDQAYQLAVAAGNTAIFKAYEILTDANDTRPLAEKVYRLFKGDQRSVNLSGRGLTEVPEVLFDIPSVSELDLSNNQLSTLPDRLKDIKGLTTIILDDNQFDYFPRVLLALDSLRNILFSNNYLTSLPKEILKMRKSLLILSLVGNQLSALPEGFENLKRLVGLYLDYNCFTSWPRQINH
ncbi:MAG: hypothetical protein AAF734_10535, partial [Bacteroidota bacterium]